MPANGRCWLTLRETAEFLVVSHSTVWRRIWRNEILTNGKALKKCRVLVFCVVETLLKQLERAARAPAAEPVAASSVGLGGEDPGAVAERIAVLLAKGLANLPPEEQLEVTQVSEKQIEARSKAAAFRQGRTDGKDRLAQIEQLTARLRKLSGRLGGTG